jgi:hypothetical protein
LAQRLVPGDALELAHAAVLRLGKVYEAVTDSYGDFWLKDVEPGEYTVLVEKDGYLPQKMGPVDAAKDINIGDIAVWKA